MDRRGYPAALAGLLALGACGDLSPANNTSMPANLAAAEAAPPGTHVVEASYTCQPAMTLAVRYDNSNPSAMTAEVTLDGTTYNMARVQSADGAKYMAGTGRAEGRTLIWWNRGAEGTLMEGNASDPMAPETDVATCTETAAPAGG
jgi:membrane-bound inhibitor of C-type lysozyme